MPPDYLTISVPGGVSDQGHGDDQTQIPGKKSEHHQGHYRQGPNYRHRHVDEQGDRADDHGGDGIGIAVQHQGNGDPADREDDAGEDKTDAAIHGNELNITD